MARSSDIEVLTESEVSYEPSSPRRWLMLGAVVSAIAWILFAFIIEILYSHLSDRQVSQIDKASSLFAVVFGLFAGANVYLKIYDYVNHRSQVRDWQHEYALRTMEQVYAPIWDEISGMLREIEHYRDPTQWKPLLAGATEAETKTYGFKEVMASHLGLFVDFATKQLVERFLDAVAEYRKEQSRMWSVLYEEATKKAKEIGDRIGLRDSSVLSQAIVPNNLVVLDPEMSRNQIVGEGNLEDFVAGLFINNHVMKSSSEQTAKKDFNEYITYLRGLQVCVTVKAKRDECFERARFAFIRLRAIIGDPSQVRPDYIMVHEFDF